MRPNNTDPTWPLTGTDARVEFDHSWRERQLVKAFNIQLAGVAMLAVMLNMSEEDFQAAGRAAMDVGRSQTEYEGAPDDV